MQLVTPSGLVPWTLVFFAVAYTVCGIPFGLLIARAMGHVDVRTTGSGNIGTTNVARSVGKGAAAATLACDVLKGLVCMVVARLALAALLFDGDAASLACSGERAWCMGVVYMGCILGHVFSPYLRFHGGKGIAVGFGAALGLWWPVALGLLAVFIVFAVPSKYVSLGSVAAAVSLPVQCVLWGFAAEAVVPVALVAAVVVWAHRENIKKLMRGEERRFGFHKADEHEAAESARPGDECDAEPARPGDEHGDGRR